MDNRVRPRIASDATNPREALPNRTPGTEFEPFTIPSWCLDLKQARDVVGRSPSISTMAEMGDSCTIRHEARVADLASAIATELGFSEQFIAAMGTVGLVHDLGKVWIPAEILARPGELTPAQFEMVKLHPQMGCEILKAAQFPSSLRDIVLQHHERVDGSGYPHGLKGENILPEAKILAVSDVVEAMASPRPYRPSLGIGAALQEIERGRRTSYDESVVDACLSLFQGKGYQLPATQSQPVMQRDR